MLLLMLLLLLLLHAFSRVDSLSSIAARKSLLQCVRAIMNELHEDQRHINLVQFAHRLQRRLHTTTFRVHHRARIGLRGGEDGAGSGTSVETVVAQTHRREGSSRRARRSSGGRNGRITPPSGRAREPRRKQEVSSPNPDLAQFQQLCRIERCVARVRGGSGALALWHAAQTRAGRLCPASQVGNHLQHTANSSRADTSTAHDAPRSQHRCSRRRIRIMRPENGGSHEQ